MTILEVGATMLVQSLHVQSTKFGAATVVEASVPLLHSQKDCRKISTGVDGSLFTDSFWEVDNTESANKES